MVWYDKILTSQMNGNDIHKIAAVSQTTFLNAFSLMKMYEFWLKFHAILFPSVQLTGHGMAPTMRQVIIWTNDG